MKRFVGLLCWIIGLGLVLVLPALSHADAAPAPSNSPEHVSYERARIVATNAQKRGYDTMRLRLVNGPERGKQVYARLAPVQYLSEAKIASYYQPGDTVVVMVARSETGTIYSVIDKFRLQPAALLLGIIFGLAIVFAGWRGVGSLLGLLLSILVLTGFVIPQVIQGHSPYLPTAIGVVIISCIGIFVAHGFSRRTAIALLGTYSTLVLAVIFALLAAAAVHLSGFGDEQALYLGDTMANLDVRGVLLCGMILSLIGILDDITVGQATVVQELQAANPNLTPGELYQRGLTVGREHIASLVNTLVLAYIGTSFLFIVFTATTAQYPLWVTLNSEHIMQEIVRSLVGSASLILAVPITTILAARLLHAASPKPNRKA